MLINVRVKAELFQYNNAFILVCKLINESFVFFDLYTNVTTILTYHMQYMLCENSNDTIGMTINSLKSSCLRIGPRHSAGVEMLIINNQPCTVLVT